MITGLLLFLRRFQENVEHADEGLAHILRRLGFLDKFHGCFAFFIRFDLEKRCFCFNDELLETFLLADRHDRGLVLIILLRLEFTRALFDMFAL